LTPNFASQMRVAFSTGSNSPGELEMTRSTSEVAVCCSSASASFFSNSRAYPRSFLSSAAWESRPTRRRGDRMNRREFITLLGSA
jgi:hypothetical protein